MPTFLEILFYLQISSTPNRVEKSFEKSSVFSI
jgi:hypothetical protein